MKTAILALLVSCATLAHAQAAPAANSIPNMVRDEITALEFIGGGSPLTPEERQQAAEIVNLAMRASPERWARADANMRAMIGTVAQKNVAQTSALREASRYAYAFPGPVIHFPDAFPVEKRIIDAHDPVIAIDAAHQRLVTRHSLEVLQVAAAWTAQSYKIAQPQADFKMVVAPLLKAQLATLEPAIGDGIAHIERNVLYAPSFYAGLTPAQHTDIFETRRAATFKNLQDPVSEQWELAEAAGMLTRFAVAQTQSNAELHATTAALLSSQQRQLKALHGAAMGASPACSVVSNSYADRAANGCF